MVVKVYGSLKSACTQRVLCCFIEKEVEFEIVNVDLPSGEHKQPNFLALQVLIFNFSFIFVVLDVIQKNCWIILTCQILFLIVFFISID